MFPAPAPGSEIDGPAPGARPLAHRRARAGAGRGGSLRRRRCRAAAATGSCTGAHRACGQRPLTGCAVLRTLGSTAVPGPLLAIDAPFVLYRSFFALPDSIKGADGQPVNALLGAANVIAADRRRPRTAGDRGLLRRRGRGVPRRAVSRLPRRTGPPVPDALDVAVRAGAGVLRRRSAGAALDSDELEADDLLGVAGDGRGRRRRAGADHDRRPRHVPVRRRAGQRAVPQVRARSASRRSTRRRCGARYGIAAGAGPRLHRAARRSVRRAARARRGSGRRRRPTCCARHGSLEGAIAGGRQERPRIARGAARRTPTSCAPSRTSPRCGPSTLERPADRETDLDGRRGARRATFGMGRLAERLENAETLADL